MDEWTLNDLLECSVCLERLDTSSKVLPCQHTFCRKCLEEIVSTHKELRCPECRILVDAQIDDLPPNVLLMRILEGIKNSGNLVPKKKNSLFQKQQQQPQLNFSQASVNSETHHPIESNKCSSLQKQNIPLARAIYDYVSKEAGDLSFRKNDYIVLHKKVNDQWCQGECDGKTGIFPLSYVQVILPFPTEVATCRALYDFRMVNDEEEGCLSFKKDEIITVIRRVDDNWGEGKLNNHIGIFPLAFVEMNDVAQALIKLPVNNQPGPSRMTSQTPNGEESTPLIPTDHPVVSNTLGLFATNEYNSTHENTSFDTFKTIKPIVSCHSNTFNSSSAVSSTTATPTSSSVTSNTSSTSSSNTSSSSNSAPNSPPKSQQPHTNPNPFVSTSLQNSNKTAPQASHITNVSIDALATDSKATQSAKNIEQPVDTYCYWVPSQPDEASNIVSQSKEKRHSVSAVTSNMHSNKHSSDIINSESQDGQLNRHGSQRHKRTNNESMSGANLPAGYVALYPYKPQKADELELKKGGYYLVTERCQDGWFKGFSVKTLKGGVFPGNYVILAKSVGVSGFRIGDGQPTLARAQTPIHKPTQQQKTLKINNVNGQLTVPKLPPRTSSPSARPLRSINHNSSTSWTPPSSDIVTTPKNISETSTSTASQPVASVLASTSNGKPQSSTSVSLSFNSTLAISKPTEKVKEKKEKSGLIKRLAAIKRSKSPTDSASYSMDNPVFDDTSAGSHQAQAQSHGLGHSHTHPVHVRSGSCPSQLIAVKLNDGSSSDVRIASALVSARLKHRERPSISYANFTPGTSRISVNNIASKAVTYATSNHKKSNSLDAADPRRPKQLVPTVRERFRCIVPYPPNSEYELELKVGDIIYVHRKREDGWYKGTQQRTGRTGLFPASFVETF